MMTSSLILMLAVMFNIFNQALTCSNYIGSDGKAKTPSQTASASDAEWEEWKARNGKSYANTAEENRRRTLFNQDAARVNEHNKNADPAGFRQSTNFMSDWTDDEKTRILGLIPPPDSSDDVESRKGKPKPASTTASPYPDSLDWRDRPNVVGPVKDQGQCGSCWAFSAVGALEMRNVIAGHPNLTLSEQEIVDCFESYGCNGGWMNPVFNYAAQKDGIYKELDYRAYSATQGACTTLDPLSFSRYAQASDALSYVDTDGTEAWLMRNIQDGPIAIAFTVRSSFYGYSSGVYSDSTCSKYYQNHAMILVGYGTENGIPYWLIRNSWGRDWGDAGYIKVRRGANMCRIQLNASFPNMVAPAKK